MKSAILGTLLVVVHFGATVQAQTNTWQVLSPTASLRYVPRGLFDCTPTETSTNPQGRNFSGSVYGDGKIYYWGGNHYAYPGNDIDVYDIATNRWTNDAEFGIRSECLDPCCAVCKGGANEGKACNIGSTDCPGGTCVLNAICVGGTNDGLICNINSGNADCPGGTCKDRRTCDNYPVGCVDSGSNVWNPPDCIPGSCWFTAGTFAKSRFRCSGGSRAGLICAQDTDCTGGGTCSIGIPTPGTVCTDCRPSTTHTYQKGAFNPVRHKPIWNLEEGVYEFDLSSRAWTWRGVPAPAAADLSKRLVLWDPVNQRLINLQVGGAAGYAGIHWFNYTTNSWSLHDGYLPFGATWIANNFGAWDASASKFVIVMWAGGSKGWFTYDPTKTGAAAWTNITAGMPGDLTTNWCSDNTGARPCFTSAIAYDATNQRTIALTVETGNALGVWAYNAGANTWAKVTTAGGTGGNQTGYPNTLHYDPNTGALYLLDRNTYWYGTLGSDSHGGNIRTLRIQLNLGNPLPTFTPANTATFTLTPTITRTPPTVTLTPTVTPTLPTPTRTPTRPTATSTATRTATPTCGAFTTWQVGPTRTYKAPCEVLGDGSTKASRVHACDRVEVDAATYVSNVNCRGALIGADRVTVVGVGGRPVLDAGGFSVQDKGIWVINGNGVTVDNFEFKCETRINPNPNCSTYVGDSYGSGIRIQGRNLTVRNSYFHDNDDGIQGGSGGGDIVVENSEFYRNGDGSGQTHNVYIGAADSLIFRANYSRDANVGHLLKSRAYKNYILTNRLMDMAGTASMEIDLPWGGLSYVIGNLLEKGAGATNSAKLVTYNAESGTNPGGYTQELYAINNTAVSDCGTLCGSGARAYLFDVTGPAFVQAWNNLFVDGGTFLRWGTTPGTSNQSGNLSTTTPGLVDRIRFDYHLTSGSPAVDAGADPGTDSHGYRLLPANQYVYDAAAQLRSTSGGGLDVGAFEYGTPVGTPTPPQPPSAPHLL